MNEVLFCRACSVPPFRFTMAVPVLILLSRSGGEGATVEIDGACAADGIGNGERGERGLCRR